jgi:hypothetical protein
VVSRPLPPFEAAAAGVDSGLGATAMNGRAVLRPKGQADTRDAAFG